MTAPLVDDRPASTDAPDLFHWVCCDWDTALCGTDVSNHPAHPPRPGDVVCVVCAELFEAPCDTCGYRGGPDD